MTIFVNKDFFTKLSKYFHTHLILHQLRAVFLKYQTEHFNRQFKLVRLKEGLVYIEFYFTHCNILIHDTTYKKTKIGTLADDTTILNTGSSSIQNINIALTYWTSGFRQRKFKLIIQVKCLFLKKFFSVDFHNNKPKSEQIKYFGMHLKKMFRRKFHIKTKRQLLQLLTTKINS